MKILSVVLMAILFAQAPLGPVEDIVEDTSSTVEQTVDDVTDTVDNTVDNVDKTVNDAVSDVNNTVDNLTDNTDRIVEDLTSGADNFVPQTPQTPQAPSTPNTTPQTSNAPQSPVPGENSGGGGDTSNTTSSSRGQSGPVQGPPAPERPTFAAEPKPTETVTEVPVESDNYVLRIIERIPNWVYFQLGFFLLVFLGLYFYAQKQRQRHKDFVEEIHQIVHHETRKE